MSTDVYELWIVKTTKNKLERMETFPPFDGCRWIYSKFEWYGTMMILIKHNYVERLLIEE